MVCNLSAGKVETGGYMGLVCQLTYPNQGAPG